MNDKDFVLSELPNALLPWYYENRRDLPWRKDRLPYHVWLSEIMLQQTRVEAVKGYYSRFLSALPDIASLASADDDLLHKLWEGLGYYTRVKNLKKAAVMIMKEYGGVFPESYEEIRKLAGIGDYTAGAIASIAFNEKTPAVDGNVLRVYSRLTASYEPIDQLSVKKAVTQALEKIYPVCAGDFTQALMELGATLCGPNRKPGCEKCPCNHFCEGFITGVAEQLPIKKPQKERKQMDLTLFILSFNGMYALEKRDREGLLAGLWQFPNTEGFLDADQAISYWTTKGILVKDILRQVEKKHVFTHIQWNMRGYYLELSRLADGFQWFTPEQIHKEAALPTAFRQFWIDRL